MKLLAEISDATLGLGDAEQLGEQYQLRKSARGIVLNERGEMATQYLQNYTYHKLPGGGVEAGETIEAALLREIKEEVGCAASILRPLGCVIEYRNQYRMLHLSYGYLLELVGEVGECALEPGEIEEGQETRWLQPAEVLRRMREEDDPQKYKGHFILAREQAFLEAFLS